MLKALHHSIATLFATVLVNIGQAVWVALYSPLNISETVRDKSLVPKDHLRKWSMVSRMVT